MVVLYRPMVELSREQSWPGSERDMRRSVTQGMGFSTVLGIKRDRERHIPFFQPGMGF